MSHQGLEDLRQDPLAGTALVSIRIVCVSEAHVQCLSTGSKSSGTRSGTVALTWGAHSSVIGRPHGPRVEQQLEPS